MANLQPIYDSDPRLHKKDYGDPSSNERDFLDWCYQHPVEYRYESIIRKRYLHHYFGTRAFDLAKALRRDFLLSYDDVNRILNHILYYNKHVQIDQLDQNDVRLFMIYKRPRFSENVMYPYSLLSYDYYDDMHKAKGKSISKPAYPDVSFDLYGYTQPHY